MQYIIINSVREYKIEIILYVSFNNININISINNRKYYSINSKIKQNLNVHLLKQITKPICK